jgi:Tfp pilus assembly protein PilO
MTVELRDVRTQLLIAVAVLLLLDVAAVAVLLSPAGRSPKARQEAYEQLRLVRMEKAKSTVSTKDMDQNIAAARQQEQDFDRQRLIARYSDMSELLSHIAGEAGVSVSDVKYDEQAAKSKEKTTPPGYDGIGITMQVHGSYTQDMRFINAVERQNVLLLIDSVSFGGMQSDELTVSVHLTTYLRSAA